MNDYCLTKHIHTHLFIYIYIYIDVDTEYGKVHANVSQLMVKFTATFKNWRASCFCINHQLMS